VNVELGKIYNCYIIVDTKGVKPTKTRLKAKTFAKGRELQLMAVNTSPMPNGYLLGFSTKDGYIIPQINVGVLDAAQMSYSEAEVLEEKGEKKLIDVKVDKSYKKTSKLMVNMSIIGGVIGLVYAIKTQGNKYLFASMGMVGGAYASKYIKK